MIMQLAFRRDIGWNVGRIISRVTGAPFHVAIFFGVGADDDVCIEAAAGYGVRKITRAQRLAKGDWSIVTVQAEPIAVRRAYAFALTQVGHGYDYVGVAWSWWFGRAAGNGIAWRWFCSELAAALLMKANVNLHRSRAAYFHPRRLWNVVKAWAD